MKLQIKYNKTVLREFQKKLTVRKKALPTLKNKEAALRAMVLETRRHLDEANKARKVLEKEMSPWQSLWNEFDFSLLEIKHIDVSAAKVAGILIPTYNGLEVEKPEFAYTSRPDWTSDGITEMEKLLAATAKIQVLDERLKLLENARKKATQKVNLFEKVQIPALESAIRQIKRYLEDEDNLSKASQKLLKNKIEMEAAS